MILNCRDTSNLIKVFQFSQINEFIAENLSSKESVCQGLVHLLTSCRIAFSVKPDRYPDYPVFPISLCSPPAVVGTVVDPADGLAPADGAADVREHRDRELVPGLKSVSDTLGL